MTSGACEAAGRGADRNRLQEQVARARETTAEDHHVGVEDVQRGRDELADDLGRGVPHPYRTRVSRPLGMHWLRTLPDRCGRRQRVRKSFAFRPHHRPM